MIPLVVYMYYVLLEAWCLDYCIELASGGFAELFAGAKEGRAPDADAAGAVVGATAGHFETSLGLIFPISPYIADPLLSCVQPARPAKAAAAEALKTVRRSKSMALLQAGVTGTPRSSGQEPPGGNGPIG